MVGLDLCAKSMEMLWKQGWLGRARTLGLAADFVARRGLLTAAGRGPVPVV